MSQLLLTMIFVKLGHSVGKSKASETTRNRQKYILTYNHKADDHR